MLTAAEAFSSGTAGAESIRAAAEFGNQTVLRLIGNGRERSSAITGLAGIIDSTESVPSFFNDLPANDFFGGTSFEPTAVPEFSRNVPIADIQSAVI